MKTKRSMVILDDRAVLVEGIRTVAQFTYPELCVSTGAEGLTRQAASWRPLPSAGGEALVIVIGGSALADLPESRLLLGLMAAGASVVAIVGSTGRADVYALRASGVNVFVCASEGINELLRAIDRAYEGDAHLSPDAAVLFSRPARRAPRISPRERQIVLLYLSENDWSVDDVARMLQISSQTVRSHLARLRSHFTAAGFSVRNRLELRQALVEVGVIDVTAEATPSLLVSPALAPAAQPSALAPAEEQTGERKTTAESRTAASRTAESNRFRYAGTPVPARRVG